MATEVRNEDFVFDDSVKKNSKGEAILGVLEGPCADIFNPTRNERQYDEELWERVFEDEIINEYFNCGGILGELDHPADRTETDTSKVAVCMPEKPKKGKDGKLYAKFDILDTPNGRIVHTLAKYGYKLGVSSRGNGDVYEAFDGKEHVDPTSFELKAFDIVLLPAVKAARLKLKESVGNKTFKQAIRESLERSKPEERAIMVQTLNNLKIDYKLEKQLVESAGSTNTNTAENNGVTAVRELQRQMKLNRELKESLKTTQEKLSVCYTKEAKYEEELAKLKLADQSSKLTEEVEALKKQVSTLTEQLSERNGVIKQQRIKLMELSKQVNKQETSLNESLNNGKSELAKKDNEIKRLTESLETVSSQAAAESKQLNEQLSELRKNAQIKTNEFNGKIIKANRIVEHYKKVAEESLNRYIESKANMLGVSVSQITNKLEETYTFDDIDTVCEELKGYQINMSKLPFKLDKNTKIKVTESVEPIKPKSRFDDDVDDSLMRLANLNF